MNVTLLKCIFHPCVTRSSTTRYLSNT